MENNSYHVPFYVVTGGIATSGHSADLTAGKVGLFDRATFSVATGIGNGKEFFFAQGATGGLDWYGQPVRNSHKSAFFFGNDVEDMYLSRPQTLENEEWVIGFNGGPSSKSLSYETGVPLRIKFYFHGQPIYRFFNGPKEYVVSYTPKADCEEPCSGSDCPEGITDCLTHTQALIDLINGHTELRKFGVTAKLVTADYSATATNMTKYCLTLCDNGDAQALNSVIAQAPVGSKVVRTVRNGSMSTYQICISDDDDAPEDFTQAGAIDLAICGECPAGSTLTAAHDTYIVNRPLAGTEDLNDPTARQTYADLVGTSYETAGTITFNGATAVEVVAASDAITLTAHGLSTGTKVNYTDGGGTQIVGLTDTNDYYVIKVDDNIIKLATTAANAYAGTAIAISDGVGAAHTLAPVITAVFVGNNGATASVKLSVGEGVVLSPVLADSVIFANSVGATCIFADATPVEWDECGAGISSSRNLRISNINRLDCTGGNRLADLTAALAGVVGIDLTTLAVVAGTDCMDDYTVTQNSQDCLDEGCLTSNVTFTYDTLPAFENQSWVVVPPTVVADETRKCGIRVTAGYIDPKFGDCSFNPMDYYETEPIKMEISMLQEDGDVCDVANWPTVAQSRIGRISRQSGEYVVRELIMKTDAYLKHVDQFSLEPRMREAFDMQLLSSVDKNAYYNLYYVRFRASYGVNGFRKKSVQETFTAVFAFKEGDASAAAFETQVLNVITAKSGVVLHINEANVGGSSGMQGIG
jgi:hypothetical protein